jgi:protein-S-isoprenylcysteine O-methyltransferase Ste14
VKVSPSPILFVKRPLDGTVLPTSQLTETLARARSLFGAGMGLASLGVLASVVRASKGLRWSADSEMARALALVDADICQALQVSFFVTTLQRNLPSLPTECERRAIRQGFYRNASGI